jgi:hypothetical protein
MNPALGFLRGCSLSSVEGLAVGRTELWSGAVFKKTVEPGARVTSPIMVLELRGACGAICGRVIGGSWNSTDEPGAWIPSPMFAFERREIRDVRPGLAVGDRQRKMRMNPALAFLRLCSPSSVERRAV